MKLFIACVVILGVTEAAVLQPLCGCMPTSPVCGSDFKTYASECQMKCDNRYSLNPPVVIYHGRCEDLFQPPGSYNPYYPNLPYNPYQPCDPNDIYSPCNQYFGSSKSN